MIPQLALWLLAISVILGQLVRFPLPGQSGGVLVSDGAVVLILLIALLQVFLDRPWIVSSMKYQVSGKRRIPHTFYLLLYTPFILWSLFTLGIQVSEYATPELLIAGSYWLRTSTYLLLVPALVYLTRFPQLHTTLHRSFIAMIVLLVSLGGLQMLFFSDLATLPPALLALAGGGWDPHVGRAVATWLDPNFFGAFLAIALVYCFGWFFLAKTQPRKLVVLILTVCIGVLLLMTQSRSSLLALGLTLLVLSPVVLLRLLHQRTRALFPMVIAVFNMTAIAAVLAAVILGQRLVGLFTFDPTVQFRLNSLSAIWQLAADRSVFGVGYNAFQFIARHEQLISDFSLHSRAGADNSFLTLLVTTGVPGLLLFILPWLTIGCQLLRRWITGGQVLAIVAVAALLTLTIHSQFINSWLYAHLLIVIAIIVALANPPHHDRLV